MDMHGNHMYVPWGHAMPTRPIQNSPLKILALPRGIREKRKHGDEQKLTHSRLTLHLLSLQVNSSKLDEGDGCAIFLMHPWTMCLRTMVSTDQSYQQGFGPLDPRDLNGKGPTPRWDPIMVRNRAFKGRNPSMQGTKILWVISQKSTKKHISREIEHPLVAESLEQVDPGLDDWTSPEDRSDHSLSLLTGWAIHLKKYVQVKLDSCSIMFSYFQGESSKNVWNHYLVSGSENTNQSGSDTQVRDHKWVLDLSLDDDDGGCNRSTQHLAVGNVSTDRAIGTRRAWYSSPSNSWRVKAPTSRGKE